jgi:hypothetical protein
MSINGAIASRIAIGFAIIVALAGVAAGMSAVAIDRPGSPPPASPGDQREVASGQSAMAPPAQEHGFLDASWEKRWWIEKTARLLRGGEGLGPDDDVDHLETLSKEEIARRFMRDERFGNTVLDFNMYFLGFKVDALTSDGEYVDAAYDFSNAISSAKALLADGDYLRLFDLDGDYYMPPLSVAPPEDELAPEDEKLTARQLRETAMDEILAPLQDLLAMRERQKPIAVDEFCAEIEELAEERDELQKQFFRAFNDTEIFVLVRGGIPDFIVNSLQWAVDTECDKPKDQIDARKLDETLTAAADQLSSTFGEFLKFEPTVYGPDRVAEFKPLDRRAFPEQKTWPAFGFEQGTALANSSTNFNRKRGAYILKRFFCDDLNPVGFDDPKEHVGGAHGSQTSCYSCHYKLDPMAGFFRNYGAQFADASTSPDIIFDDLASMDRENYLAAWRAPQGAKRKWDVGYIRSPRWTAQNSYGESLGDLSRIIRDAPEAKRCLMKRLTEYMLGAGQTLDGGYLDDLTQNFEKEAASNSSAAFKNAMIRVLKSNAYRTLNPDPQHCYDLGSKSKTENRPPCRVAYILEKNCAQCHSGDDHLSRLNLSKWIAGPGGDRMTFEHLNEEGRQFPAETSLQRIAGRLSSTDPAIRMPKSRPMSSQERQELYLWVRQELSRMGTH